MNGQVHEIDWQAALTSPIFVEIESRDCSSWPPTKVVSVPIPKRRVKTSSYFFDQGDLASSDREEPSLPGVVRAPTTHAAGQHANGLTNERKRRRTRIQPPKDIVKLGDRLFYLLQPPLETLLESSTLELPFPPFDFQFSGVGFLFPRHAAILADEMGLGKTMQAITSIRMLLRSGTVKRVLLICPKPLVTNWQREFALWAPEIPVSAVTGNQAKRRWHWHADPTPVKIANYELIVRDQDTVVDLDEPFDLVVLDEAQRIKNGNSATSQTVRKIKRHRSWGLTGTPIENGIEDLVGIFEFISPGAININMSPREIRDEVSDYVLRRTKDMVLDDMPPKLIRDTELELSSDQLRTYEQAENDGVLRLNDMGEGITIKHVFELVLRLKQICNFDPMTGSSSKMELLAADMEEVAASGQKAIVFSQWVKTLEQIAERLPQHHPLAFHGRIPSKQRDGILEEFRHSPDRHVLLMSYGAGSVGLNLQFCRYVYLFDRWWNPAVEDQAINRAHRIGAAGSVTVTRMLMSGTIEQRIHEILEAKRELFNEILSDSQTATSRGLTQDDIFGLFNLKIPHGSIFKESTKHVA